MLLVLLQRSWIPSMIAAVAIACSGRTEPTAPLAACAGPVAARVESAGAEASFTWTPRCGLFAISVVPPPTVGIPIEMWVIVSNGQLIEPGIRYGERPPGTQTDVPAMPVTRGKTYAVFLTGERGKPPVGTLSWTP